jgi:hypothetical protein
MIGRKPVIEKLEVIIRLLSHFCYETSDFVLGFRILCA